MTEFSQPMSADDETRQLLDQSATEWFADNADIRHFRKLRDQHGCVPSLTHWPEMVELGWAAVLVDEAAGGSGLSFATSAVLLERAGQHLTASPLLGTAFVAVTALMKASRNEYTDGLLQAIVSGEACVALAFDDNNHHDPESTVTTARPAGDNWIISGRKLAVADATSASHFLVIARREDSEQPELFVVNADAVTRTPVGLIDSREYAHVELDSISVDATARLETTEQGHSLLETVLAAARIAMATEMLGTATAAFDMTIDYLKVREQFGQLIGSFQALQHRCAQMHVELELLRSSLQRAQRALDDGAADLPVLACQSKALAAETLHLISNETVQLHGGIGMTDEHDAGLFLKRARVCEQLFGSAAYLRRRYAELRGF